MSIQQEKFKAIADKIRKYTLDDEPIRPNDFVTEIDRVHEIGFENGVSKGVQDSENYILGGEW